VWTLNTGGSLTIKTDAHAKAPASMTGALGNLVETITTLEPVQ